MGRRLAGLGKSVPPEAIETFRLEILNTLRKPSTTRRITNSLWKHYTHYRKISGKTIPDIQSPQALRNVTTIAKEVLLMERKALEDDVMNGTSPVLYRQKRNETGPSRGLSRKDAMDAAPSMTAGDGDMGSDPE